MSQFDKKIIKTTEQATVNDFIIHVELIELKRLLPDMVRFEPSKEDLELLRDGGVAIIDQWICAHAR